MRAVCVCVVGVFEGGRDHMFPRVSVLEQLRVKAAASGLKSDPWSSQTSHSGGVW